MPYQKEEVRAVVGARLRQERKRLKLTQQQLADIGGVRKQAQLKYESGDSSPNAEYLALVHQHGVDVQFVVCGIPSAQMSGDEVAVLHRYRAAPPAVRAAVAAALGTVPVGGARERKSGDIHAENIGGVVQGDMHVKRPMNISVGGKKGKKK